MFPGQLSVVEQILGPISHLDEDRRRRWIGRRRCRLQEMRQTTGCSDPDRAVTIFEEPVRIAVIPDQAVPRRIAPPGPPVEKLDATILAEPDPVAAVYPQEHHFVRSQVRYRKAFDIAVLHLKAGHSRAGAVDPRPAGFVDRYILQ